jgi:hypothetical protein
MHQMPAQNWKADTELAKSCKRSTFRIEEALQQAQEVQEVSSWDVVLGQSQCADEIDVHHFRLGLCRSSVRQ